MSDAEDFCRAICAGVGFMAIFPEFRRFALLRGEAWATPPAHRYAEGYDG